MYLLQYHLFTDGHQIYTFKPDHSRNPNPHFQLSTEITSVDSKPLRFKLPKSECMILCLLQSNIVKMSSFLFWQYSILNSGSRSHSTSHFLCWGLFQGRVSRTICLGWLLTEILLISASWIARITGVSHLCLARWILHLHENLLNIWKKALCSHWTFCYTGTM
jgi:hypothetical protein